jgi:hypothetical protein
MCKLIEERSYGKLYDDVPTWGNALVFMRGELQMPVHRVSVVTLRDRRWSITGQQMVDGPCVYFEDANGCELGCWTQGINRLQVFTTPRSVHETMRADKTLWSFTPTWKLRVRSERSEE